MPNVDEWMSWESDPTCHTIIQEFGIRREFYGYGWHMGSSSTINACFVNYNVILHYVRNA